MNRTITALIIIAGVICLGLFAFQAIQKSGPASLDSMTIGMTSVETLRKQPGLRVRIISASACS